MSRHSYRSFVIKKFFLNNLNVNLLVTAMAILDKRCVLVPRNYLLGSQETGDLSWFQEIISWDPRRQEIHKIPGDFLVGSKKQEICRGSKRLSPRIPGDRKFTRSQEIFSWDPKQQEIQHYMLSIGLGCPYI